MTGTEAKTYSVYILTFSDGRKYVGLTRRDVEERWRKGRGYRNTKGVREAIESSGGWDNVKKEVVASGLSEEDGQSLEIKLIAELKANDRAYGLNTKPGGQVFGEHSKEFLQNTRKRMENNKYCVGRKISREHVRKLYEGRKKNGFKVKKTGRKLTEEQKRKISVKAKERWKSEEFRKHMAEVQKGMFAGEKNPRYGVTLSEETRRKISEARKGQKVSEEARRKMSKSRPKRMVAQLDDNMNVIATYRSVREAAKSVGAVATNISFVCRHPNRKIKGFYWRYADGNS